MKDRNIKPEKDKNRYEREIGEFIKFISDIKNLSDSTAADYRRDIREFLLYNGKGAAEFNQTDIMRFISSLQRKGQKNSTLNRKLSSIKTYISYLLNTGKIDSDPSIGIKIERDEREIPDILTVQEIEKLMNAPDTNTDIGTRDRAIMEIIYGLGLKAGEISDLNLDDVNLEGGYIVKKDSSGERFIPLNKKAEKSLEDYKKYVRYTMDKEETDALFLNKYGKRLSRQSIWKMIKDYGIKVGINKNVSPALLRHSFAVHMLENGVNIEQVREILGHQSIATTQIYREKTDESLSSAFKRAHPRD